MLPILVILRLGLPKNLVVKDRFFTKEVQNDTGVVIGFYKNLPVTHV